MSRETQKSSIKAHPGLSVSKKLEEVHRGKRFGCHWPFTSHIYWRGIGHLRHRFLPIMILYLFLQRYIIRGIMLTGLKG